MHRLIEFFHKKNYEILIVMYLFILFLQILDIHSTKLVISTDSGYELNPAFQEINEGIFYRAILAKLDDLLSMFIWLLIFIFSSAFVHHINFKHEHLFNIAVEHFMHSLDYFVFTVFFAVIIYHLCVVVYNYSLVLF